MKTTRLVLAIFALLVLNGPSFAQTGLRLGTPGYGGTGCPGGTAAVSLSADGTLSLRFTRYQVSVGGGSSRTFDRKSCSLAIPVHVPAGKRVSIVAVEVRGKNSLSASAKTQLNVESFISGGRGPRLTQTFTGPRSGPFVAPMRVGSANWSSCGADVTLRSNSSLRVSSTKGRLASASSASIIYRLQWRNC